MRYALIGCGRISPNHIVAAKNSNLTIVAICDLSKENMDDKIKKFELEETISTYYDYRQMLERENLELVAIATESGKHAEIAKDCIKHGCHIIVEKPIALSLEDIDEMIALAEEYNVKICACHQNRFNKAIQKMKDAIDKNRFGRLFYGTAHIRWSRDYEYYARAKWRGTWEQDGGTLMNQCIHDIDLLRWLMGEEVEEVVGMTDRLNHDYIEAEDMGLALIKFKNGSYGIVEGTVDVYPRNLEETLYIFGEKGTVKAGGEAVNLIEEWNFSDYLDESEQVKKEFSENPPNIYGNGHSRVYKDMIEAINENRKPYVDAQEGRNAVELVLAIYKAAYEHRIVSLPLKKCSSVDFKGRFDHGIY